MGIDAMIVRHRFGGRALPDRPMDRRLGGERRRRLAPAPHPGAARRLHRAATSASLEGRHVAIVGDVKHSRVARSNIEMFATLGAKVTLVAPPTLLPAVTEGLAGPGRHDLDAVLPTVDVCYLLRMQLERHGRGARAQR
jgi:hypothetical protein